jgi:hypothetical protein
VREQILSKGGTKMRRLAAVFSTGAIKAGGTGKPISRFRYIADFTRRTVG